MRRYIRQPAGYRAFIPTPLPPEPPVAMAGPQDLLSRADRALGRLDGSVLTLPNPDLFAFMYVRKEAVLCSQIEGTQSSLQDVLAAEARIFDRERPSDVREVLNYIEALRYGLGRLLITFLLMREEHRNRITDNTGYAAGNGHRVLEVLYKQPIVAVKDVVAITGTTYAAANQLVKRMVMLGLLEEITGQARNRRFRYAHYIRLFADEESAVPASPDERGRPRAPSDNGNGNGNGKWYERYPDL